MLVFTQNLSKLGLPFRKWSFNDNKLILSLPGVLRETAEKDKILDKDYKITALGVRWSPNQDFLKSATNLDPLKTTTLSSETSKLSDPMGWLASIISSYKLLLQNVWIEGIEWDQQFPQDIETE